MSLRRSISVNYASNAWSVTALLVCTPIYLRLLGVEAFGLIGAFTVLQAALGLLDVGLSPALSRSMAQYTAGAVNIQSLRHLLRSIEWVVGILAALIFIGLWLASDWLAGAWLKTTALPEAAVGNALAVFALVIALRFVENVYRSSLIGLQRQVELGVLTMLTTTLRTVGAVAALTVFGPTITVFFVWQAIAAIASVIILGLALYRLLPMATARARFSREALRGIADFAGGMTAIAMLGLLLTQIDKMVLSYLIPLEEFGSYTLAVTAASAVALPLAPIAQALHPRLSALAARSDEQQLAEVFHMGARLTAAIVATMCWVLIAFSNPLMRLWLGHDELAAGVGLLASIYAIGTMFNSIMSVPFYLQLAHGWTRLMLVVNAIAIVLMAFALTIVIPRYGTLGTACAWAVLNVGCFLVVPTLMHRRILVGAKWTWYLHDTLLPITISAGVVLAVRLALYSNDPVNGTIAGALAGALGLSLSSLTVPAVRRVVSDAARAIFHTDFRVWPIGASRDSRNR